MRDAVHTLIDGGGDFNLLHLVRARSPRLYDSAPDDVDAYIRGHHGVDRTLFELAVSYRYTEMVEWLIGLGADPTRPNGEGKTPRDVADERNAPARIRELLGMGEALSAR